MQKRWVQQKLFQRGARAQFAAVAGCGIELRSIKRLKEIYGNKSVVSRTPRGVHIWKISRGRPKPDHSGVGGMKHLRHSPE